MSDMSKLQAQNRMLLERLAEAEDTLEAIRSGEIDALVVNEGALEKIFTLKSADYTYRRLVEAMHEGAVTISADHTIIYSNQSFADLINKPLQKTIGSNLNDFFAEADRAMFDALFESAYEVPAISTETILYGDGRQLPVYLSFAPLEIEGERAVNIIVTDLTERVMAEDSRMEAMKLKEEERVKNEFIGIASHELKTPVTSMKIYTQILERRFNRTGDDEAARNMSRINAQLNKLTSLIGDLLDVTKMEKGVLDFHTSRFDYDELVDETVQSLQLTTEEHALHLSGKTGVSLDGDRDRIGQVLTNLIENAIKYSPDHKAIYIRVYREKGMVVTSVEDKGIGMSEEEQKQVFERYYRASGPNMKSFPGMGLGLYISAEIVKRLGGRIWVEAVKGQGSTFYFSLPEKTE